MISIVCVYNDKKKFKEYLLKSLENQTAKFELIKIDNTGGLLKSASEGLNYGGRKAKGKYIMFVHQDVILHSKFWLADVERILDKIPSLGIAGCAGKTVNNEKEGFIKDRKCLWGRPFIKPREVQTLDECILIIPKNVFEKFKFDENLQGWHIYGVDYCLTIKENGLKAYVIPAFIHHNSPTLNLKNLFQMQKEVWMKHRANYPYIFTTTGELYWGRLLIPSFAKKVLRPIYRKIFPVIPNYNEHLEKEVENYERILFLHWGRELLAQSRLLPYLIKAESFLPQGIFIKKGILHWYISAKDIEKNKFRERSFDAVILTSEILNNLRDPSPIIEKIEKWAKKEVIIIELEEFSKEKGKFSSTDIEKWGFVKRDKGRNLFKVRKSLSVEPIYVKIL